MKTLTSIVNRHYKGWNNLSLSIALVMCVFFFNYHIVDIKMPEVFEDYVKSGGVSDFVASCNPLELPENRGVLRYYVVCVEHQLTPYPRLVPLIISSGVLFMSFVLARKITSSNIVGLVTISTLLSTLIIHKFASSTTYDQLWVLFLLLSLFYINSKYALLAYMASFLSKALTLAFIPMMLYHIYENKNKNNILLFSLTALVGVAAIFLGINQVYSGLQIDTVKIDGTLQDPWGTLQSIFYQDNFALAACILVIPLMGLLYRDKNARIPLLWVGGIFVITVGLHLFTNETMYAYRLIPMLVFTGIGYGIFAQNMIRRIKQWNHSV